MKKEIILSLLILIFSGLSIAQYVEINEAEEFPTQLTGGESFELGLNYSVGVDREVPLSLELNVSGDESVPEEAFDVRVGEEEYEFVDGAYRVNLNDSSEDGSATLEVDSNVRLRPGNYDFSLDLLSSVGVGEEVEEVSLTEGETEEVEGDYVEVEIEASENGTANVTELGFVGAEPPSDNSEFVGGVEVNVQDDEGNDIGSNSSGIVRVNFDEDDVEGLERDSLSVYFYNESTGNWEALDSTVGDNFVEADVDHFSVYSVYGEEEDDSSGSSSISIDSGDDEPQTPEQDQTEENDSEDESSSDSEDDSGDTGSQDSDQDDSETGQDDQVAEEPGSGESNTQGLTGQFTETASNPVFVGFALIALLLGGLVYSGRYKDILEKIRRLDIR